LVAASAGVTASMAPTTSPTATPMHRVIPLDPRTASPPIWRLPARAVASGVESRSETRINTDPPRLPCCFVHLYHGIRKETVTLEQHGPKSGLMQAGLKFHVGGRFSALCEQTFTENRQSYGVG